MSGRNHAGRFAKGNPGGPGRPRRPDLYTIAAERAAAEDVDLDAELWSICKELIARAKGGDVQAAKLVLGSLCAADAVRLDVGMTGIPRRRQLRSR